LIYNLGTVLEAMEKKDEAIEQFQTDFTKWIATKTSAAKKWDSITGGSENFNTARAG